ncbi:hypothetical protein [Actinomadura sp. 9N407]|uniref:hypothetical protein n=1 Tax=Actinomadura sp. 9N407 TaxID=3375154 RepID=UPI00379B1BAF
MAVFRLVTVVTVLTCAGVLTGCQGGGDDDAAGKTSAAPPATAPGAPAPATTARPPSPSKPAAAPCPSRAQIADAVSAADGSSGVIVSDEITCQGGWATTEMRYPGSDPSRVIVRTRSGKVSLVTYGTDALCDGPKMANAPAKIRKALGPYC